MNFDACRWIESLGLVPHPEGGHFREVYRSADRLPAAGLPARYGADRCAATSIYFLLEGAAISRLHRLRSDEIWYHHAGGVLLLSMILPDGTCHGIRLGADPAGGATPQAVIPRGAWFGARLESESEFALVGCAVAPGFEFADFELGTRRQLIALYPEYRATIEDLTDQSD